jgi:hypothetical protein
MKDKNNNYLGSVSVVDTTNGKVTPLAAVQANKDFYFDLSPDNKKALFVALRADKPGTDLDKGPSFDTKLFELDISGGNLRTIDKKASFAIYSRDGKQVLLGMPPEGFSLEQLSLVVADAGLTKFTPIVQDAYMPFMSMTGEGKTYPGWVNDKTIFYFTQRRVYGTEGKSLNLMSIGTDGKGKKLLQPVLDTAAFEGEK